MISTTDMHVSKQVRELRELAGLSIEMAAAVCGLEARIYQATEDGKRRFQSHELLKPTKAISVPIADLYRDLPQPD